MSKGKGKKDKAVNLTPATQSVLFGDVLTMGEGDGGGADPLQAIISQLQATQIMLVARLRWPDNPEVAEALMEAYREQNEWTMKPDAPCSFCGKVRSLRPAGPKKEAVCYPCAAKDKEAFGKYLRSMTALDDPRMAVARDELEMSADEVQALVSLLKGRYNAAGE